MIVDRPLTSVHLTNAYHPTSGGVRSFYQSILKTANRLGRPVRLIVPGSDHGVEQVGAFGRIYFVKAPRAFAFDRRYRLIMPTRYLVPWITGIRHILRDEAPDILEICDKHSLFYVAGLYKKGWIGTRPRPTLVATSAERFDDNVGTFLSNDARTQAFARWFMRTIYAPMFDFHLANSEYTAGELRAALPPHRQHVVHICPPALGADGFVIRPDVRLKPDARTDTASDHDARNALLARVRGNPQTKVLAYVGRLSPEKNLGLLVDTMRALGAKVRKDGVTFTLIVAGDGPDRERLEAAATELPGRIHQLGNLASRTLVRELLGACDVFVHPNPREPFGIAPLEAMAAGLPVVLPDSGGVLSYADDTTAWLARPTASAFASAVEAIVADPELAARRAAAAVERASDFHEALVVPRFFELLDGLHRLRVLGQAAATPEAIAEGMAREAATSR